MLVSKADGIYQTPNFSVTHANHQASRLKTFETYNPRQVVPDNVVKWILRWPLYDPKYAHDSDKDLLAPKEVAQSYETPRLTQHNGFPVNPIGRTGLKGRGKLYYFGPNHAADTLAVKKTESGYKLLVIQRNDKTWALPGGFLNKNEQPEKAAFREFKEEALCNVNFDLKQLSNEPLKIVYQGYADDPRNTDNAWIETSAYLLVLKPGINEKIFRAGDDAQNIKWIDINSPEAKDLYGGHSAIVELAVREQLNQGKK